MHGFHTQLLRTRASKALPQPRSNRIHRWKRVERQGGVWSERVQLAGVISALTQGPNVDLVNDEPEVACSSQAALLAA